VVCAQAVEWARRAGIAIYARATFDAEDDASAKQTVIRKFAPSEQLTARAVVAEGNVVLAHLADVARLPELLRVAEAARVSFKDLSADARGVTFLVPLLNVPDWAGAKKQLTLGLPGLALTEGVAVASVVGDGFAATPEPLARFLGALGSAAPGSAAPARVTATPLRLSAVIEADAAGPAQRALHAAFVAG
jgi:aspartate kinase